MDSLARIVATITFYVVFMVTFAIGMSVFGSLDQP